MLLVLSIACLFVILHLLYVLTLVRTVDVSNRASKLVFDFTLNLEIYFVALTNRFRLLNPFYRDLTPRLELEAVDELFSTIQ